MAGGVDSVLIEKAINLVAKVTTFAKAVKINLGDGDMDFLTIGGTTADRKAIFSKPAVFDGGPGAAETLTLGASNQFPAGQPTVLNFA